MNIMVIECDNVRCLYSNKAFRVRKRRNIEESNAEIITTDMAQLSLRTTPAPARQQPGTVQPGHYPGTKPSNALTPEGVGGLSTLP